MSYKTILIHAADEHRFTAPLSAAIAIAKTCSSHVIGLGVMPPIIIVPGMEADAGTVIEDHRKLYKPQLERMRQTFENRLRAAGVAGEWLDLDCEVDNPFGNAAAVVLREARTADLVVAAQANPDWSLSAHLDVAEQLIMEGGRPVLVVPKSYSADIAFGRIMVAWNSSREAARALADALPLLTAAESVLIAEAAQDGEENPAQISASTRMTAALARHGVVGKKVAAIDDASNAGAAILAAAERNRADLLIMGCYGHSRLRELILGGASRHILQRMQIPVLLSH